MAALMAKLMRQMECLLHECELHFRVCACPPCKGRPWLCKVFGQ